MKKPLRLRDWRADDERGLESFDGMSMFTMDNADTENLKHILTANNLYCDLWEGICERGSTYICEGTSDGPVHLFSRVNDGLVLHIGFCPDNYPAWDIGFIKVAKGCLAQMINDYEPYDNYLVQKDNTTGRIDIDQGHVVWSGSDMQVESVQGLVTPQFSGETPARRRSEFAGKAFEITEMQQRAHELKVEIWGTAFGTVLRENFHLSKVVTHFDSPFQLGFGNFKDKGTVTVKTLGETTEVATDYVKAGPEGEVIILTNTGTEQPIMHVFYGGQIFEGDAERKLWADMVIQSFKYHRLISSDYTEYYNRLKGDA